MSNIKQQKKAISKAIRDYGHEHLNMFAGDDASDAEKVAVEAMRAEIKARIEHLEAAVETIEKVEKLGQLFLELAEAIKPTAP